MNTHIFKEANHVVHWLANFGRVNHCNEFWYDVFSRDLEVMISSVNREDRRIRFIAK